MALLMNKLDDLNEGTPGIQNVNSSHPDVTDAGQEQESSTVSHVGFMYKVTHSVLCRHAV